MRSRCAARPRRSATQPALRSEESLTDLARSLNEGLRRAAVRRVVIAGGAGSLEVARGLPLLDSADFPAEWKPEALQAAEALHYYRTVDDLDCNPPGIPTR